MDKQTGNIYPSRELAMADILRVLNQQGVNPDQAKKEAEERVITGHYGSLRKRQKKIRKQLAREALKARVRWARL